MPVRSAIRLALAAVLVVSLLLVAPVLAAASPVHGLGMGRGSGSHPFVPAPGSGVGASGVAIESTSTNWSGYVVQTAFPTGANNTVSDVSASWIVPTVTGGGATDAYAANWIGIDGFTSPTVEQIGTEQDWISGAPYYAAWWEMYPGGSVNITSMSIHAGDVMTATVHWISASQFTLSMTNTTTGQTFSTTQTMSGGAERSCAEWIVEAPSSNTGVLPFTKMGPSTFTACSATVNGVTGPISGSGWQFQSINLADGTGAPLAIPTALTAGGTAFVVNAPGAVSGDIVAPSTVSDVVANYNNSAVIHLTATDNPGGSGVAYTAYQVDGGTVQKGNTITVSTYDMHSIKYWSVDVAGNSETPHIDSFMVNDTIAPTTSSNSVANYAGFASFTLTGTDNAGGSGVANTFYSIDGVAYVAGKSVNVTQLGMHTVFFYSVDKAGNSETPHAVTFNITAGPGPTTIGISTNATAVTRGKSFILSGVVSPTILVGTSIQVMVKYPTKSFYSYSSARTVYMNGSLPSWWYRYKTLTSQPAGAYKFYAFVPASANFLYAQSPTLNVTFR